MLFKKLGKSETMIPSIGQGTGNIGMDYNCSSHEYNIRYGIDHGLTLVDTSESYMDGLVETAVGKSIRGIRDKVILSTKVMPRNLRYADVISSAEKSLKRLRVEAIDLYQIHWPNVNIDISETLRAFEKLYKDGKIKFVGFSNFLPMEIEKSCHKDYSFNGIVSNQMEYNLYDRFSEKSLIPYCRQNDITSICYSPFNRGNMFEKKDYLLLQKIANKYDKTIYQISLNWLISQEGVTVIPFSSKLEHIKQNSEASDFNLKKEDLDLISENIYGKIYYCNINDVKIIEEGFGNHKVYNNKEEAIENKFNFSPSPLELSQFLLRLTEDQIKMIKPIRAIRSNDSFYKYDIIEGRVRYWGWVIAFNEQREIPLYIIDRS